MQKWMRFALISLCNGQRTLHGGKRRKMLRKSHSSHIIIIFQCGGLSILVGTSMNQRLKKPTSSLDGFMAILWATRLNKDVRTFPLFFQRLLLFQKRNRTNACMEVSFFILFKIWIYYWIIFSMRKKSIHNLSKSQCWICLSKGEGRSYSGVQQSDYSPQAEDLEFGWNWLIVLTEYKTITEDNLCVNMTLKMRS